MTRHTSVLAKSPVKCNQATPLKLRKLRCDVLLPFSLSDLFSCSVSVRVSTELDRLDRQELRSDDLPRSPWHQSRLLFSGDVVAWLSASRSRAVPTEKPRRDTPRSEQKVRPCCGGGSYIPRWRRLKCCPETQPHNLSCDDRYTLNRHKRAVYF